MPGQPLFEVFYDGDCPLCVKEIRWLQKRDRQRRQQIQFTDIAAADFDATRLGKTYDQLMAEIHGRTADGRWVQGVEVFRYLYAAAGFPKMVRLSRCLGVRQGLNLGYRVFAKYRTRLTGRCQDGKCGIPQPSPSPAAESARDSRILAKETGV